MFRPILVLTTQTSIVHMMRVISVHACRGRGVSDGPKPRRACSFNSSHAVLAFVVAAVAAAAADDEHGPALAAVSWVGRHDEVFGSVFSCELGSLS